MFKTLLVKTTLTTALLSLALGGCKYEAKPFVSNLGIEVPCVPTADFYAAVDLHVKEQLQNFRSEVDQRDGPAKYQELAQLFQTAKQEAMDCHYYYLSTGGSNVDLDYKLDFQLKFTRIWSIVDLYEMLEKEWEDADLTLLEEGLSGKAVEPNWEQLSPTDCSSVLVAENANSDLNVQHGGCQE